MSGGAFGMRPPRPQQMQAPKSPGVNALRTPQGRHGSNARGRPS